MAAAAAQGDRSENAEYTYGKRRLREIDRRVRFLRRRLDGMVVVDQPPADAARVFFGAWVVLEAQDGARARYRIVGPDEFDMAPGYISMDSPLGALALRRAARRGGDRRGARGALPVPDRLDRVRGGGVLGAPTR